MPFRASASWRRFRPSFEQYEAPWFSEGLFLCPTAAFPVAEGPDAVHQYPAESGEQSHGIQPEIFDEHPCQNGAQGDMRTGAQQGDGDFSNAVEVSGKGIAGEVEDIEDRDQLQVACRAVEGRSVMFSQKEGGGPFGGKPQDQRRHCAQPGKQCHTFPEAEPYAFPVARAVVLRRDDGCGRSAAVAEGVGKGFDAGRCRVGRDGRRPHGIDGTPHSQFADIQACLLESGNEAVMSGTPQKRKMQAPVFATEHEFGHGVVQPEQAGQSGCRLSDERGPCRALDAPA